MQEIMDEPPRFAARIEIGSRRMRDVAELERSPIAKWVRAGQRNARAKGKKPGRLRVSVDPAKVAARRAQGQSWPKIARELGVSVGTVYQAGRSLSNNLSQW
jgi:DNA invertase Pin-like site-specific DNA recombinase